jgi:hypothetical protein
MGLGSEIRDPEKTYPGSRGQKGTGSRIRIRNTASEHPKPKEVLQKRRADNLGVSFSVPDLELIGTDTDRSLGNLFEYFSVVWIQFFLSQCGFRSGSVSREPNQLHIHVNPDHKKLNFYMKITVH